MEKSSSSKTLRKLSAPLQLARTRVTTAEMSVEKAKLESRAAKQKRKQAKDAARRAKKRLRRAKDELAEARGAVIRAEEKLAGRARRASSQGRRLVPITGSRRPASRRVKMITHQTKAQDRDSPLVVATLPTVEPSPSKSTETMPVANAAGVAA